MENNQVLPSLYQAKKKENTSNPTELNQNISTSNHVDNNSR
jgi:hypothetical protein